MKSLYVTLYQATFFFCSLGFCIGHGLKITRARSWKMTIYKSHMPLQSACDHVVCSYGAQNRCVDPHSFTARLDSWCVPFASKFLAWQREMMALGAPHVLVTWLELIFVVMGCESWQFPHPASSRLGTCWTLPTERPADSHNHCTVATYQAYLRGMIKALVGFFQVRFEMARGVDLSCCGVFMPLSGVALLVTDEVLRAARTKLAAFTCNRPVRTANDLSRPAYR